MTTPLQDSAEVYDLADEQLIDAEADSVPQPQPPVGSSAAARFLLGVSLVLIAFNLRPVFSSASALLPEIKTELGLSSLKTNVLVIEILDAARQSAREGRTIRLPLND